jgi:hypothetical protein
VPRTDLGIIPVAGIINLPELVHDEKDPILRITSRLSSDIPRNR